MVGFNLDPKKAGELFREVAKQMSFAKSLAFLMFVIWSLNSHC